jgi:hypothetical protein
MELFFDRTHRLPLLSISTELAQWSTSASCTIWQMPLSMCPAAILWGPLCWPSTVRLGHLDHQRQSSYSSSLLGRLVRYAPLSQSVRHRRRDPAALHPRKHGASYRCRGAIHLVHSC